MLMLTAEQLQMLHNPVLCRYSFASSNGPLKCDLVGPVTVAHICCSSSVEGDGVQQLDCA